ncbi:hypothetical protein B7494_g1018 [Chlorociboria aeruginascens]|nr:hypothetical protein B7494_g1018 [Chlorociboria aeruginascens]
MPILRPVTRYLQNRVKVLIRTGYSIIYIYIDESDVMRKADSLWGDVTVYETAYLAEQKAQATSSGVRPISIRPAHHEILWA